MNNKNIRAAKRRGMIGKALYNPVDNRPQALKQKKDKKKNENTTTN